MNPGLVQEIAIRDARIAPYAVSLQPAWLWSSDGAAVLWTNAAGAAALGFSDHARIGEPLGGFDPHRRQVAQLAGRLPKSGAVRLERMRGFGAPAVQLATCSCALLTLEDGSQTILIASLIGTGKPPPLSERLQFILDWLDRPAVALSAHGAMLAANAAAQVDISHVAQFSRPAFVAAREQALRDGHAETSIEARAELYRVGTGHEVGVVVLMPARDAPAAPVETMVASGVEAGESDEAPLDESFADEVLVDEDEPATAETPTISPSLPPPPDEPAPRPAPVVRDVAPQETVATDVAPSSSAPMAAPDDDAAPANRPLRFLWQMDADTRFSLGSDEFSKLIGPMAAAALGRPWHEIAAHFGIDPKQKIVKAIASHETWSGIVVEWPMSSHGKRMPIEMSGLPVFDRGRNFAGYRGFGICRDVAGLERLAAMRRQESLWGTVHPAPAPAPSEEIVTETPAVAAPAEPSIPDAPAPEPPVTEPRPDSTLPEQGAALAPLANVAPEPKPADNSAESPAVESPPQNVVPFRIVEPRAPALSAVENHAFDEIARRLSARLEQGAQQSEIEPAIDLPESADHSQATDGSPTPTTPWVAGRGSTRGVSTQDKPLLDRVPAGILIYRLDHLLYANQAFLTRTGFASLHALSEAGGLDALYVQPIEPSASSSSESGMPLSIATGNAPDKPMMAHLYSIAWDGEPAMALIFDAEAPTIPDQAPEAQRIVDVAQVAPSPQRPAVNDDLASIIEAMADGIVMFDQEGNILSCNRSAEALFNETAAQLTQRNLAELFAPESQSVVLAYFEGLDNPATLSLVDHGREVLGQLRSGGLIPLSMTMGRTADGKYFAVFRDLSQLKKNEADLISARRIAERAASSRADVLAKISHEIRIPLNAIIGFAEAMIEQRLGPLGAERYLDYMRDIRAAGERVLTIVGDMLNLTRIETGKLDLAPTSVNLNDLVAQCVGALQPLANRERIIIRSSLAHHLPVVVADAQSLRQIVGSLIASSIELANAGGQVIVSTALTDNGDVALRVRDTGRSLSDRDIKAAVEPYRISAGDDHVVPDTAGINLALTKALAEANRARLNIRKAPQAGTLIEVLFPAATQAAAGG